MKKPTKLKSKKLIKVADKVHRRVRMRAADTGTEMGTVLEEATDKWKKYDLPDRGPGS